MIRLFYILLFAAVRFLPGWITASLFAISFIVFMLLWRAKWAEVERDFIVIIPALCFSWFVVPYFIFLYCSWTVLLLAPVTSGHFPKFLEVKADSGFFDRKNIILLASLILIAYLAATISYKTFFHIKRILFSILYGVAAFTLAWLKAKKLPRPPFTLFYIPAIVLVVYTLSLMDLKLHLPADNPIVGVIVTVLFTMLFYLLDMIPKKYFWLALGVQFAIFLLFGARIFTLFTAFFIIQNLLVYSYRPAATFIRRPYDHISRPATLLHFLPLLTLSLFYILAGRRYTGELYPLIPASFAFSIYYLYKNHLYANVISERLVKLQTALRIGIQFILFNTILIIFFLILDVFKAVTIRQLVTILFVVNITAGFQEYQTTQHTRQNIWSEQADPLVFNILTVLIIFVCQQLFGIFG